MGWSLAECRARVTEEELCHWMALCRLEPFGNDVEWFRHAEIMCLLYNINSKRPKKLIDFLPERMKDEWKKAEDESIMLQLQQMLKNAAIAQGYGITHG